MEGLEWALVEHFIFCRCFPSISFCFSTAIRQLMARWRSNFLFVSGEGCKISTRSLTRTCFFRQFVGESCCVAHCSCREAVSSLITFLNEGDPVGNVGAFPCKLAMCFLRGTLMALLMFCCYYLLNKQSEHEFCSFKFHKQENKQNFKVNEFKFNIRNRE